MLGMSARWLGVLVAVVGFILLLSPRTAAAESKVEFLAKQLATSDDFRVRTQAALALGASADAGAVNPLCSALSKDANASVRTASAAALAKLAKPAGSKCLTDAKKKEKDSAVLAQIDRAIADLAGDAPPPPGPDAKFYIAVKITNNTTRTNEEIESLVRKAAVGALLGDKQMAVAPRAESQAQANGVIKGKKLRGYMMMLTVEAPSYASGKLNVSVGVSVWSYPDQSLKATGGKKTATQENTTNKDVVSENELLKLVSEAAAKSFSKTVASL